MMAGRVDKVTTFKLFVKNLAPGTTTDELKSVFETVGRVVECQIFRTTLAFVHMQDEIGGRNAILMLNAKLINGKCVAVEESKHGGQASLPTTRIRVRNVPNSLSAKALLQLFSKYGAILSVEISDDEGIVTIEAVADIRSAINDLNGYDCEGQKLIVEPIVNTAITYSPKHIRPVPTPLSTAYPQKYSGPPRPRPFHGRGASPMARPRGYYDFYPNMNSSLNGHNPEGRVLRDPRGAIGSNPEQGFLPRPSFPSAYFPPRPMFPPALVRHAVPCPTAPKLNNSNVTIEPLFFKRHEFTSGQQQASTNNNAFYEDDPLDNFHIPPPPPPPLMESSFNPKPTPLLGFQQQRFAGKRSAPHQPDPEEGEAYQVPGMIGPGEFRPPKKYFANHPDRPKRKKKKTEPRPQPPIPDEVYKPVPDFSSYYNTVPSGSILRPFPPPVNTESNFSDDVGGFTF